MAQVTNIVLLKLNGQKIQTKGDVSFNPGTPEREAVFADGRMVGYTEAPNASEIEFKIAHTPDLDIVELGNTVEASVIVETDTGSVWQVSNAFTTSPPNLAGESDGDVSITMRGDPAIKVA